MTTASRPMFYQPVFGNDNGYATFDAVDVAAFSAPALRRKDAAATEQPAPKRKPLARS